MEHAHVNRSGGKYSQLVFSRFSTIFDIDVDLDVYDDQMSIVSTGNEIN